jgi:hypothetical protein
MPAPSDIAYTIFSMFGPITATSIVFAGLIDAPSDNIFINLLRSDRFVPAACIVMLPAFVAKSVRSYFTLFIVVPTSYAVPYPE